MGVENSENVGAERGESLSEGSAEAHRAFAREMDQRFGRSYGLGGGFVLVVMVAIVLAAFSFDVLGSPATWMVTLTSGLIALFVVRSRVNRLRGELRGRVEQYCTVNELSVESFRAYFSAQGLYPYFGALFEQRGA